MALVTLVKHYVSAMMSFTDFSHSVDRVFKSLLRKGNNGGIDRSAGWVCAHSSRFLCSLKDLVYLVVHES